LGKTKTLGNMPTPNVITRVMCSSALILEALLAVLS